MNDPQPQGHMASHVERRKFLAALGGAAAAWPLAARAQQPTEGRNVAIEYRWAEGRNERYEEIAAEFARLKVDVIATATTPAALAAKQTTAVIPIVFAAAGDPVGTGLVASLARPGANVTGLSNQVSDTGGKKLEFSARGCSRSPPVGRHGQCH